MPDDNLLLLKLLGRDFRDNWPFYKDKIRNSLEMWQKKILADLSKLIVLGVCVWAGYIVFLYYLQSVWSIFVATPMGGIFATQVSPEIVTVVTSVLDSKLSGIAFSCVSNTLLISVQIGIFLKFSGLYRLTYLNSGSTGSIFWGFVCTLATADLLPITGSSGYLQGNSVIYFLPTICLLSTCFALSARLVPEFTVAFEVTAFLRERVKIIKIRDIPYDQQEI